jgi:hypothetical protein
MSNKYEETKYGCCCWDLKCVRCEKAAGNHGGFDRDGLYCQGKSTGRAEDQFLSSTQHVDKGTWRNSYPCPHHCKQCDGYHN